MCRYSCFQFEVIKKFVDGGGSMLVLMSEGGETKYTTNVNFLLEEYGVFVNNGEILPVNYFMLVYVKKFGTVYCKKKESLSHIFCINIWPVQIVLVHGYQIGDVQSIFIIK